MKTTETIKEQRQRREARRKMLCDAQSRDSAIEAENALQAVRDSLLCIKEDGSIGIRSSLYFEDDRAKPFTDKSACSEVNPSLYRPKVGLDGITPDWGFIRKRQNENSMFLYEGKRVIVTETSLSYGIAGEFTGGFAEFEFVDGIKDRFHIRSIPNGLIYCKEYELV